MKAMQGPRLRADSLGKQSGTSGKKPVKTYQALKIRVQKRAVFAVGLFFMKAMSGKGRSRNWKEKESVVSKDEINAFLGSGTVYHGKLTFQGTVRIDGTFTGEIMSEGVLVAGKDAVIEGILDVGELVLSGKLKGELRAARRVIFHKTGFFQGQLTTAALAVEEGATIDGQICMLGEPSGGPTNEES